MASMATCNDDILEETYSLEDLTVDCMLVQSTGPHEPVMGSLTIANAMVSIDISMETEDTVVD